jgi:hypothetical protein
VAGGNVTCHTPFIQTLVKIRPPQAYGLYWRHTPGLHEWAG